LSLYFNVKLWDITNKTQQLVIVTSSIYRPYYYKINLMEQTLWKSFVLKVSIVWWQQMTLIIFTLSMKIIPQSDSVRKWDVDIVIDFVIEVWLARKRWNSSWNIEKVNTYPVTLHKSAQKRETRQKHFNY
jgi:hypothetical protein